MEDQWGRRPRSQRRGDPHEIPCRKPRITLRLLPPPAWTSSPLPTLAVAITTTSPATGPRPSGQRLKQGCWCGSTSTAAWPAPKGSSPVEWTSDPLGDGRALHSDGGGRCRQRESVRRRRCGDDRHGGPGRREPGPGRGVRFRPIGDGEYDGRSVTLVGQAEPEIDVILEGTGRARSRTTRAGSRSPGCPWPWARTRSLSMPPTSRAIPPHSTS